MSAAAKPRFKLRPVVVAEHPLQRQIADALRIEIAPAGRVSTHGVVWWAVDAANYGGAVPGTRMARGLCAGVADLFLLHCGKAHFIEIKTDIGVLSDAQRSVCAAVIASGGQVGVVRDAAEVMACLDEWQIPRARRIREAAV